MAKRKNITRVPTWRVQWKRGRQGGNGMGNAREKTSCGREKKKSGGESSLFLSLSFDETSYGSTRGEKEREGTKGGNREEEGFVAERGFQRSQLLDASRSAKAGRGVVACIDVKREFREFLSRVRALYALHVVSCVGSLTFDSSRAWANWFPPLLRNLASVRIAI